MTFMKLIPAQILQESSQLRKVKNEEKNHPTDSKIAYFQNQCLTYIEISKEKQLILLEKPTIHPFNTLQVSKQ